ncbi:tetratricopeptide repeat protein, partial [Microcoleus sp. K5-D4]|uniref:tetratricopeptide repeat protein n=1 Tax=Microcoleus sp. K5-D4 TaxID=2818801 RepID=UPI002FCEC6A5
MLRQIWQSIINLWRQIQRHFRKPAPPPPKPTPIPTFGEYEQKFLQLLEGVEKGWSRGEIKGFLIACNIKDAEWENWLQEFGERLLVSPETHLELGGRMVRLGEMNCGKLSEVGGKIGWQLLAGESLNRKDEEGRWVGNENIVTRLLDGKNLSQTPADDSSVGNENIVTRLLARQSLSATPTDNPSVITENIEVNPEAEELYNQGRKFYYAGDLEGAIATYEKALEIDPQFHFAWNGLGLALTDLSHYSEAIAAFETALEIDPKFHFAWYGL